MFSSIAYTQGNQSKETTNKTKRI